MFYEKLAESKRDRQESGIGGYVAGAPVALSGAYLAHRHGIAQPKAKFDKNYGAMNRMYDGELKKVEEEADALRAKRQAPFPQLFEFDTKNRPSHNSILLDRNRFDEEPELLAKAIRADGGRPGVLKNLQVYDLLDAGAEVEDLEEISRSLRAMDPDGAGKMIKGVLTQREAESLIEGARAHRGLDDELSRTLGKTLGIVENREREGRSLHKQLEADIDARKGGALGRFGLGVAGAYGVKKLYDRYARRSQEKRAAFYEKLAEARDEKKG